MKLGKLLLAFAALTLAVASAASPKKYSVTIYDPTYVGATQLQPGDYKMEIQDGKAVFKMGKTVIESPAKVETAPSKYDATTVQVNTVNGKPVVQEIHVGGTGTKVVFPQGASAGGTE